MRRLILASLAAMAVLPAVAAPAGAARPAGATGAAAFAVPRVSTDLTKKPSIGRAHGRAPKRLRTKDVVVGTGRTARRGDQVEAQYVGVLYRGGKQFDASWDAGRPIAFQLGVGQVIPGWDRGVKGMKVGGRRILVIPARLAYGAQGSPPAIPPRAALIFVVDLVGVSG